MHDGRAHGKSKGIELEIRFELLQKQMALFMVPQDPAANSTPQLVAINFC